ADATPGADLNHGVAYPPPLLRPALPERRDVGVLRLLRADRAGRLHRVHAPRLGRAEPLGLDGRQGVVLPRAAADRTAAAVLGAGRRDGVLPGALAKE